MQDLINRQAAIDTLADMYCKSDEDGYVWIIRSDAWARIDALPSAQPEIIHCEECKYRKDNFMGDWCTCWCGWTSLDGHCHKGANKDE